LKIIFVNVKGTLQAFLTSGLLQRDFLDFGRFFKIRGILCAQKGNKWECNPLSDEVFQRSWTNNTQFTAKTWKKHIGELERPVYFYFS
jgi:hypothetical protein